MCGVQDNPSEGQSCRAIHLNILGIGLCVSSNSARVLEELAHLYSAYVCTRSIRPFRAHTVLLTVTASGMEISFEGRKALVANANRSWPSPSDLVQMIVERERADLAFVHGACIELEGAGVLFIGPSTTGKTTLALALAQCGGSVLSLDLTPISLGISRAYPFPCSGGLRLNTRQIAAQNRWSLDCHRSPGCMDSGLPISHVFFLEKASVSTVVDVSQNRRDWNTLRALVLGHAPPSAPDTPARLHLHTPADFDHPPRLTPCPRGWAIRHFCRCSHEYDVPPRQLVGSVAHCLARAKCWRLEAGYLHATVDLARNTVLGEKERLPELLRRDNVQREVQND